MEHTGAMKTAVLRGPILSKSGYGTHCRQIFRWMLDAGYDVRCNITPWGITSWHVNPDDLNGLVGAAMQRTSSPQTDTDLSIQVQLPHEWDSTLSRFNIGVTAGVETNKAPSHWAECVSKMDLVIVPSSFSRDGLVAAGAPAEKIKVVPESFSDSLLDEHRGHLRHLELDYIDTHYNFLMFGQVTSNDPDTDRKNLLYTVKWFCEEFKGDKSVGLVIKSNLGTNCVFQKIQLENMFRSLVKEVRQGEFPKVYLINGDMSNDDCASLMMNPKINSLLSLTKGEGYGLPLVDAAASGLPIIATNWSGHLDFLKFGKFSKVSYELKKVPHEKLDKSIFVEGSSWAMPIESDAKKRMRKAVESNKVPAEWSNELRTKIQENFSFKAVSKRYDEVIGRSS